MKKDTPERQPASTMADRLKVVFDTVEYHAITLKGFKLLRAAVKDTGYRTEVVLKAISDNKKHHIKYEITEENIQDSQSLDASRD